MTKDARDGISPSSTGITVRLNGVAEQGGWPKLDILEAGHEIVEERGTTVKGLAKGEDTRVGLASVADGVIEGHNRFP